MKKLFLVFVCSTALGIAASAQLERPKYRIDVPAAGTTITADNITLSNSGCTLEGHVTEQPIMRLPSYLPHNVPGIMTNINQIGNTWVIQCTAGPGYCFTWYDAR